MGVICINFNKTVVQHSQTTAVLKYFSLAYVLRKKLLWHYLVLDFFFFFMEAEFQVCKKLSATGSGGDELLLIISPGGLSFRSEV